MNRAYPLTERKSTVSLFGVLLVGNLLAWAWALWAFDGDTVLLGTGLLAYSFGLRHAVDADHIVAIDNATRKLMQERVKTASVGFYFSLGHSAVVDGDGLCSACCKHLTEGIRAVALDW